MHRRTIYFVYPPESFLSCNPRRIVKCHSRFQARKQAKRYGYCDGKLSPIMRCQYYYDRPREYWIGTACIML